MSVSRRDGGDRRNVNCFVHESEQAVGICSVCARGVCKTCCNRDTAGLLACSECEARQTTASRIARILSSAPRGSRQESLTCSFCGKREAEVRKLIAGPTVFICDGCVALCNQILADEGRD